MKGIRGLGSRGLWRRLELRVETSLHEGEWGVCQGEYTSLLAMAWRAGLY